LSTTQSRVYIRNILEKQVSRQPGFWDLNGHLRESRSGLGHVTWFRSNVCMCVCVCVCVGNFPWITLNGFSFRIRDCIGSCISVCHCHDWSHNSVVLSEVPELQSCSQVSLYLSIVNHNSPVQSLFLSWVVDTVSLIIWTSIIRTPAQILDTNVQYPLQTVSSVQWLNWTQAWS
jgi:hypothetical protein